MPVALSRLEITEVIEGLPDLEQWAIHQSTDQQLKNILSGSEKCALQLQPRDTENGVIFFDFSTGNARLCVPVVLRQNVLNVLHGQVHGGRSTTLRMVKSHYCWPNMNHDIFRWVRCCLQCQRTKVNRHTFFSIAPFAPPEWRFGHIHIDLVGPLPTSKGCSYMLTCVDWFTRWPEA